jgi:hypothetical protein
VAENLYRQAMGDGRAAVTAAIGDPIISRPFRLCRNVAEGAIRFRIEFQPP